MLSNIKQLLKIGQQTARLMVGMPDYATYLEQMQQAFPEQIPMDRATFFRERTEARYSRDSNGAAPNRCC